MSQVQVTLKLATSLDGAIALASGESRWITSPEARAQGHRLRAAHDAILVGIGTALADDPELTARFEPAPPRQPLRIVLDRGARLPAHARLIASRDQGEVLVACAETAPEARREALSAAGARVATISVRPGESELQAGLRLFADQFGVRSLLVEGGGQVAAAFLREGLVQRLEWFRAPILIGGDGVRGVGALALSRLDAAPRFERIAFQALGPDLWESYKRI